MPQICLICSNPDRYQIDREIIENGNLSEISKKFNVSYNSLYSHAQNHVSKKLAKVFEKQDSIRSTNLMSKIDDMISKAEDIFQRNYDSQKDLTALKALDSLKNSFQLLLNISSQLHAQRTLELQILRERSGETNQAKNEEFAQAIKNLSFEELEVLNRLINKANHNNTDIIVKNGRILSYRSNNPKE